MELTDKSEIEDTMHKENIKKFKQTNSTPVMTEPLVFELRFLEDSLACDRILQGTYILSPSLEKYSTACIEELAKPVSLHHTPEVAITTEGF